MPALPDIPSPAEVATSVVPGVAELAAAGRWLSDRHNQVRILWTVSGMVMILAGMSVIATTAASKPVTKVVTTAAKVVT